MAEVFVLLKCKIIFPIVIFGIFAVMLPVVWSEESGSVQQSVED